MMKPCSTCTVPNHVSGRCSVTRWYILANILGALVWVLRRTGRLKIENVDNLHSLASSGNVCICLNHPSKLETVAVPSIFWTEWRDNERLFFWSVARPFHRSIRWTMPGLRCIRTDQPRRLLKASRDVLASRGILVKYPEGHRTCKAVESLTADGKVLGRCDGRTLKLGLVDTTVLPAWVDFGDVRTPHGLPRSLYRVLFVHPMTIRFGTPVPIGALTSGEDIERILLKT